MRIAIPLKQNEFSLNFSNCDQFAFVEIKAGTRQIVDAQYKTPSSFSLGILARWIRENEVDLIIAGGMSLEAKDIFAQNHIDVRVGFLNSSIKAVTEKFIESQLSPGETTETKK